MALMFNPAQVENQNSNPATFEVKNTLNQLEKLLENLSTPTLPQYIDLVSYISTINSLSALSQRLAISLVSSLTIFINFTSTHTTSPTISIHKTLLSKIFSLFRRFTLEITSSPLAKLRLRKTLKSFYYFHHNLVNDFLQTIDKSSQDLFNLLRKISILSETVPLLWTLNAFKHLILSPNNILSTFPTYTSTNFPFLPEEKLNKGTVVLDLDNTLIFTNEQRVFVRPGAVLFIKEMTELFEVVLFTASLKPYADFVMSKIDVNDSVKLRLYREHLSYDEFGYFKNLDMLGRDLKRVVIVDDLESNFRHHKNNGILIGCWTGDAENRELEKVSETIKSFFN